MARPISEVPRGPVVRRAAIAAAATGTTAEGSMVVIPAGDAEACGPPEAPGDGAAAAGDAVAMALATRGDEARGGEAASTSTTANAAIEASNSRHSVTFRPTVRKRLRNWER